MNLFRLSHTCIWVATEGLSTLTQDSVGVSHPYVWLLKEVSRNE